MGGLSIHSAMSWSLGRRYFTDHRDGRWAALDEATDLSTRWSSTSNSCRQNSKQQKRNETTREFTLTCHYLSPSSSINPDYQCLMIARGQSQSHIPSHQLTTILYQPTTTMLFVWSTIINLYQPFAPRSTITILLRIRHNYYQPWSAVFILILNHNQLESPRTILLFDLFWFFLSFWCFSWPSRTLGKRPRTLEDCSSWCCWQFASSATAGSRWPSTGAPGPHGSEIVWQPTLS